MKMNGFYQVSIYLEKFSSVEAQDEMLREIIRSEIEMNTASLKNTGDNIKKEKNIESVN